MLLPSEAPVPAAGQQGAQSFPSPAGFKGPGQGRRSNMTKRRQESSDTGLCDREGSLALAGAPGLLMEGLANGRWNE